MWQGRTAGYLRTGVVGELLDDLTVDFVPQLAVFDSFGQQPALLFEDVAGAETRELARWARLAGRLGTPGRGGDWVGEGRGGVEDGVGVGDADADWTVALAVAHDALDDLEDQDGVLVERAVEDQEGGSEGLLDASE